MRPVTVTGRSGASAATFSGSLNLAGSRLAPLAWQAVRDGERVRGVLRPLGGDRWEVVEIDEGED